VQIKLRSPNALSTLATAGQNLLLTNASTGTSGVLFAEGDFTGGDKSVTTGDTLSVTYTFSLTSS
jgi:hypothetical protein